MSEISELQRAKTSCLSVQRDCEERASRFAAGSPERVHWDNCAWGAVRCGNQIDWDSNQRPAPLAEDGWSTTPPTAPGLYLTYTNARKIAFGDGITVAQVVERSGGLVYRTLGTSHFDPLPTHGRAHIFWRRPAIPIPEPPELGERGP